MNLTLRLGTSDDADRCGTICYEAFTAIAVSVREECVLVRLPEQ